MKLTKQNQRDRHQVIQDELAWHEEEAHRRIPLDKLLYADPAFDVVINSGVSFVDPNPKQWLLEIGCGEGKESVKFHDKQAKFVSIDLSHVQLQRARELMQEKFGHVNAFFVQANAEELPFAKDSFNAIYAKAVLHHLDLDIAYGEFSRAMTDNGRIAITEPLAHHPMIQFGRFSTPRLRTKDERPIPYHEFHEFAERFSQSDVTSFFLMAPLAYALRILPGGEKLFVHFHRFLQWVDVQLFRFLPFSKRFAWYSIIRAKV
jgi:ubiquinone/menaquinone biosynthesis C-methylase UbiE